MKHLTLKAAMLAMILLLTGCGEAAGTGKTQGTAAEQSQPQTAEQSQLQTAEQSQLQTAEQSLPQTAVLLTEKDYSEQEKKSLEILEDRGRYLSGKAGSASEGYCHSG